MPVSPKSMRARTLVASLFSAILLLTIAGAHAVEAIGGSFSLTAHTGKQIASDDLRGRPYAVFFGFTHCPDVCPTTLFDASEVLAALGPKGDEIVMLFITVDPERDTLDVLGDYVGAFDERILGLRGDAEQTAAAARAFRATYEKVPLPDGGYNVNHTAVTYLMDRHGRFFDVINYNAPLETQIEKYRAVLDAH